MMHSVVMMHRTIVRTGEVSVQTSRSRVIRGVLSRMTPALSRGTETPVVNLNF